MLGPIGKTAKSLLTRGGYELYRPTTFERTIMRSPFEDWFSTNIHLFSEVYAANRAALSAIPAWTRAEDLDSSLWRYGVPEAWETGAQGLNRTGLNEVEREVTYSDLLVFIGKVMNAPIDYLEIGVSVGKNFYQICRQFPNAKIVGLDVERANPVLCAAIGGSGDTLSWDSGVDQTVDTLHGGDRSAQIRLGQYEIGATGSQPIIYLRGDQFSDDTWASLKGRKFNFIFSDGVHTAEAVRRELDFLLTHNLLDTNRPFVMYWDDLVNIEMQSAFVDCAKQLVEKFGAGSWFGLHWIHGTYGNKRLNGLFSNFRAPTILA